MHHGGRFNPKGMASLYTSLSVTTALAEYQQGFPRRPQPVTLCAYEVDCASVLDLTDSATRKKYRITLKTLECPWELLAGEGEEPPSWAMSRRLIGHNIAGLIVPSFAPNAPADARNLVLWRWNCPDCGCSVSLIDDENRLGL